MNNRALRFDENGLPIFGSIVDGVTYKKRPAAYVIVMRPEGRIAAVGAKGAYFLPGGGSLPGEPPEETVIREVREELARSVEIISEIGRAVQYFFADERHYRMQAVFFAAVFTSDATGVGEHQLLWLASSEFVRRAFHHYHAWAVRQMARRANK
jgi:8-oxo-dGTP pyrophosphatase MutT (NUDIX family)